MLDPLKKMQYPKYFDQLPLIKLYDPLAELLGACKEGYIEFSYLDVVKSAGHSCPSVAGAYLICLYGLKELYKEQLPTRGDIEVSFAGRVQEGALGVMANVVTQITGAAGEGGFKGLSNRYSRDNLLSFQAPIEADVKFTSRAQNRSVFVSYTPNKVLSDPKQQELMLKILSQKSTLEEREEFGKLWQKRVEKIFANANQLLEVTISE